MSNSSFYFSLRIMFFLFLLMCFQSFFYFDSDYYFSIGSPHLNTPDHIFYAGLVSDFDLDPAISSLNNYIVVSIYSFFNYFGASDLVVVSCFVNLFFLVCAYARVELLSYSVTRRFLSPLFFVAVLTVLPFSVLINKDSFAVLFYVVLVSFLFSYRKFDLVLLLLLMPIRIQFFMVFVFSLFILCGVRSGVKFRVVFLYFLGGAVALYIERAELLFSHGGYAEGGVSYFISMLNNNYYIGSFIFNILKPFQYVYDLYRGAVYDPSFIGGAVYFFRIYLFFMICLFFVCFFRAVFFPWSFFSNRDDGVVAVAVVVCSFFLVYMISPIVNYRYLINIAPIVVLLFFYSRNNYNVRDFKFAR